MREKLTIDRDSCPKCKSDIFLRHYYSVLVTLQAWPSIMAVGVIIVLAGLGLSLDVSSVLLFVVASAFPLCMKPLRKGACDRCGIEFRIECPHPELLSKAQKED